MPTRIQALFVVAKGPHRGHSLTATGLRYAFRHHRQISGAATVHLHVPLHSFGTALAEAGAGLLVLQALLRSPAGGDPRPRTTPRALA